MIAAAQHAGQSMPLAEVLAYPGCEGAHTSITGIQLDSRKVRPGDIFLALPGEIHDGRQFIEQAVANGAAAVAAEAPVGGFVEGLAVPLVELPELRQDVGYIASRFYGCPSREMRMVGVTGTNGKTTTSRLIAQLQRAMGRSCGVIGTLGASLSDEVSEAGNTTPDPVSLQAQLARWCEQGVATVSMEVSSHALVQGRVNGIEFDTAVYTNLSQDHLDYHGSMDAYGRAKLQLFVSEDLTSAVINLDDIFAARVQAVIENDVQVLTYSVVGAGADVRVEDARFHAGGVTGRMCSPWGSGNFNSPLPGDFNLANVAAAVATLALADEDFTALLDAVSDLRPVPGRMQAIQNTGDLQVVIDYAHSPDALRQVLQALRPHTRGRLVTVFGCGGDRDREKRQIMGRIACDLCDQVVLTNDNPRSENPTDILRDIEAGCTGDYAIIPDRAEAIDKALSEACAGDCVLIAGKGHENYQLIEGEQLFFSDEEQARCALAGRPAQ